jgi:tripeptidyl-peptidase-1
MYYLLLSVLLYLTSVPLGSSAKATDLTPSWNDIYTKHRWSAVPGKWYNIGRPPVGTTIDLRIALKPQNENYLIDVLYEVSHPKHPRHDLFSLPLTAHILTSDAATS